MGKDTWSRSRWSTSLYPGSGQVPVCCSKQGPEPGLADLGWVATSKEKHVDYTLSRVAREAVGLYEQLIQGDPRAGVALGFWGPGKEILATILPTSGSHLLLLLKSKAVVSAHS